MKYTISATIPVMSYGNIEPSIEVEADSFEEAQAKVMPHIEKLWSDYGEKPLTRKNTEGRLIKAFVGGDIMYEDLSHTYSWKGIKYLSASEYANSLRKPFDKDKISKLMADKVGASAMDIVDMWELKGDISKGFGTAIHAALELYGRYKGLAESLNKETHLHDHPVIKKAVEGFYEGRGDEEAELEVVVVDHKAKHAGRVDRILILDAYKKICRIQDFKTNADIKKELDNYWEQLKFYKGIMEAGGWTVQGLDIFHWAGEWANYSQEAK